MIPAEVSRDVGGPEPGEDTVDLQYDHEEKTITIHPPEKADDHPDVAQEPAALSQ